MNFRGIFPHRRSFPSALADKARLLSSCDKQTIKIIPIGRGGEMTSFRKHLTLSCAFGGMSNLPAVSIRFASTNLTVVSFVGAFSLSYPFYRAVGDSG